MPKRGENIRKRKDGRWEGRYKSNNSGKSGYTSVYGRTYSEVKEKLKYRKQTISNALLTKPNICLFKDILSLWMNNNSIRIKGSTENKYNYLIEKHIVPALGNHELSSINIFIVNNFLNRKITSGRLDGKGGLSSSYVRTIAHIISSAINFAANEHMCQPITLIQKPTAEKKDLSILSFSDQQKLENFLLCDLTETKLGVLLSLNLGLRIGEVCALSWNDIDFEMGIIHICSTVSRVKNNFIINDISGTPSPSTGVKTKLIIDKPKTKSSLRDIPIPAKLLPILKNMKNRSSSNYVISKCEKFVSPRSYEYRYHRLLQQCGIAPINYHALRHTFATRCVEAGVDVKTLSEILGHANVSITLNTYVHPSIELKRVQLEKFCSFSSEQNLKVVKNVV